MVGTSSISRKEGNLRKGGVDLEKGGGGRMTPLTNYALWYISIEFYLLYQKVNVS